MNHKLTSHNDFDKTSKPFHDEIICQFNASRICSSRWSIKLCNLRCITVYVRCKKELNCEKRTIPQLWRNIQFEIPMGDGKFVRVF